jgi:type II secretory pathway pseudopilin PulG
MTYRTNRGDTLIEVLLGITIFSMLAVGSMYLMNRGIVAAQDSLEYTAARNMIENQAELLRHLNAITLISGGRTVGPIVAPVSGPLAEWRKITTPAPGLLRTTVYPYDDIGKGDNCQGILTGSPIVPGAPAHKFFIDPNSGYIKSNPADFRIPATYAQIREISPGTMVSEGVWIEAVKNTADATRAPLGVTLSDFYDFHIRACWSSADGRTTSTLGTIVRLYEPK